MKIRTFRVLICVVVLCAVLVSISPIRAKSFVATATFAAVAIPAAELAASALVTLGVMAGADQLIFDGAINDLVGYASPNDPYIRGLQCIRDTGETIYYATADFLESVRCWLFDSGTVTVTSQVYSPGSVVTLTTGDSLVVQQTCYRVQFIIPSLSGLGTSYTFCDWLFSETDKNLTYYLNGSEDLSQGESYGRYRVFRTYKGVSSGFASGYFSIGIEGVDYTSSQDNRIIWCFENGLFGVTVAEGFVAGNVPLTPIAGGARSDVLSEWANRQLHVTTPNPLTGEDETTVYFPIIAGTYEDIKGMTQAEALAGAGVLTNPGVEAEEDEKYEVVDTSIVGTFQGVTLAPVDTPAPIVPDVPSTEYTLKLTDFFPFCIPFDIYDFLSMLAAEPEAPVFEWVIPVPKADVVIPISVNLSSWDGVAKLFRTLELLAFIVGLGMITRDKFTRG